MTARTRNTAFALVLIALSGCASGSLDSETARRSSATLVDDANVGAYDTWNVLAPTDDDATVVIVGNGPGGANGVARFLASDDGAVTIIVEAEGTSSQYDFGSDGALVGEAHAPAADELLAEMISDLDARRDELLSIAGRTPAVSEDGAAREALSGGLDFGCVWINLVAVWFGRAPLACVPAPAPPSSLSLLINTPFGTVRSVRWRLAGMEGTEQPVTLDRTRDEFLTFVRMDVPAGTAAGIDLEINYWQSGLELTKWVHTRGGWATTRHQVVELYDLCLVPCDIGICTRGGGEGTVCTDTF